MSSRLLTAALLALAACSAPPAPVPVAALPSAAPLPAESAPPPAKAPEISCDSLLAPHRERVKSLGDRRSPEMDTFGVCLPTKDGYWLIGFDKIGETQESGTDHLDVEWSISHVGRDGSRASRSDKARWNGYTSVSLDKPLVFDYDGDGVEELFFHRSDDERESAGSETTYFVTFRGGRVEPYAPGKGLEAREARDVDGDGRPDLVTFAPYIGIGDGSQSGFTYRLRGPELLAHSLPNGDFSRNDAAARAFAKTKCPAKPKVIVPRSKDPSAPHDGEVVENIVCARIWGAKAASLVGEIKKNCRAEDKLFDEKAKGQNCGARKLLIQWAEMDPPVSLP